MRPFYLIYRTIAARVGTAGVIIASLMFVPAPVSAEIRFGVLPRLSTMELHAMFNPLAEYLTRETGEKVSLVIPRDFQAFKRGVQSGQIDLGFANSLIYVQLNTGRNLEPLAVASEPGSGTRFRGIIIARKESSISSVLDLRGKKLSFVDRDSAAGYMFQMLLLRKAGLDIQRDFTVLPFARKHDNVTMAVFTGAADAGGIREGDLDKMAGSVDLGRIKIVGYTDYFPNWPVFSTSRLSHGAKVRIKAALLKLKPGKRQTRKVLAEARLSGFERVSDEAYDDLRRAARLAGAL